MLGKGIFEFERLSKFSQLGKSKLLPFSDTNDNRKLNPDNLIIP